MTNIVHNKMISYSLRINLDSIKLISYEKEGEGFSLFSYEDENYNIYIQSADNSVEMMESFIQTVVMSKAQALKNIYSLLGGAFQVFIWDKNTKELSSVCDYLGVGAALFSNQKENEFVFFANYLYFEELDLDLVVSKEGLVAHLGFGYHVEPFSYIYKNIHMLIGRKRYTFSLGKVDVEEIENIMCKNKSTEIPNTFQEAMSSTYYKEKYFIGSTAGKDSLAILSSLDKSTSYKTGSFGDRDCADVLQGEEISKALGLEYKSISLCEADEFDHYAKVIANASGGLATASYVDMMKFVDKAIAEDHAYLMGEGGESIRSFFNTAENDVDIAMKNYITPKEFLVNCLNESELGKYQDYPRNLIDTVVSTYKEDDLKITLMQFYRFGRMPGNFSNRHRILNTYRDKCIPFLGKQMIKDSFSLNMKSYDNDGVHRKIVESNNNRLLPYFDKPLQKKTSVQDWERRIQGGIGKRLLILLEENIDVLSEVFDKDKLIDFTKKEMKNPGRGIYFLFRILSLSLFLRNKNVSFRN